MDEPVIGPESEVPLEELLDLYGAAGWTAYTGHPEVLLTDDEKARRACYEALGYKEIRDFGEGTLRAFARFD